MIVGIDLGTTNSAIGVWRNDAVELIPNALGDRLTPSAVSLLPDGTVLTGRAARERQTTHPDQTATAFKRYMGTNRQTRLGDRDSLPEELSALVLRSLKADAEAYLGEPVTEAVITVPAYFNDKQRKATRRAGELAGLKVERLLNEPTAAALAYGLNERDVETRFLVFDLGGGTFDVSIVELFDGIIEVRASTGDNRLGGEDFNDLLAKKFWESLPQGTGSRNRVGAVERVRLAAERARRALTEMDKTAMTAVVDDAEHSLAVSATEFEAWSEPLLQRLRAPVQRAMRDSGLRLDLLSEVILVGGATRMPIVRRLVTRMFGRFPSHAVDVDEAVAIGAAVQAGLKSRDAALKDMVLTDVCPYSLGISIGERGLKGKFRGGVFSPIIERGTVIPASRVQTYETVRDGQTQIDIVIYQGESRHVGENIRLGALKVPVPPARAGEARVDVRFSYDINGLLEVNTRDHLGGGEMELVIVEDDAVTAQELAERRETLARLKAHPRDDEVNREALARANRCYEDNLGEARAFIGACIAAFETALEGQDPRVIAEARAILAQHLDPFDGGVWL